jgi:hypothetical protein
MNKSAKYGKSAARSTATGTVLKKSAAKLMKGAFRPISILAVFNVSDFSDGTMDAKYKAMAKLYVLSELEIYCERNNNYQAIINQQYLDNADKY